MKVFSIHDFTGKDVPASTEGKVLLDAEVVMGRCIETDHHFIAFGRAAFIDMLNTGQAQDGILVVELDGRPESTEMEYLIAMCQVMKGRDEYVEGFDPALEDVALVGGRFAKLPHVQSETATAREGQHRVRVFTLKKGITPR
jgi:hypothetical protein